MFSTDIIIINTEEHYCCQYIVNSKTLFGINKNVLMTTIMFVACIKVIYAAAQQET